MGRSKMIAIASAVVALVVVVASCDVGDPAVDELLCTGPTTVPAPANDGRACTPADPQSKDALDASSTTYSRTCDYHDPMTSTDRSVDLEVHVPPLTPGPGGRDATPRRVAIYFHGGGWVSGGHAGLDSFPATPNFRGGGSAIRAQVARGWIVISAEYRLSDVAAFPAQVIDARAAVNCAKDLGDALPVTIDPDHVVVSGGSAGGHLATLVALAAAVPSDPIPEPTAPASSVSGHAQGGTTTRTTVHAAVNLDGPTDLDELDDTILGGYPMIPVPPGPPGTPGTMTTFADLTGQLLCGSAYSGIEHVPGTTPAVYPCADFDDWYDAASPIEYVDDLPDGADDELPRIYLACGDTPGMPEGFQDCGQHRTFKDAIDDRFACDPLLGPCSDGNANFDRSSDARVWIDDTSDNLRTDPTTSSLVLPNLHGNHLTIDITLNLSALQVFLDR